MNRKKTITLLVAIIMLLSALFLSSCGQEKETKTFKSLDDLKNAKFAISDGNSSYEPNIKKDLPGVTFNRYTNYYDTFIAVANGNADAAFCFKYTFIGLKQSYPQLEYVESTIQIPIVANFSDNNEALRADFNKFVAESQENGLLEELAEKWMYGYDELGDDDIVDFSDLSGENGSFKLATINDNLPYEYLRNGKLTGLEPAVVYEFCKARGYKPEVIESRFDAVLSGIATGKYDMAVSGYGYTSERSDNSNFSDSYFSDTVVYTVNGGNASSGVFGSIKESFERTFIKEQRWKLLTNGMLVTFLITVFSVVIGALFGFALFLISRKTKWLEKLSLIINDTLESLPILVVLMVFFYVIFGKSTIPGVIVSIMVFGLAFTFTFFTLMLNSVKGIPVEQTEAGLALGYNDRQTLFKVVLPQAMEGFLPAIKSAIVATLKGTAVVGYVAVQDLTKAGDLIRSQTFEAFMPIITVAILYFLIAKILIKVLNKILVTPSEKRKLEKEGR